MKRDREWFSKELPKMKEFWDSVLFYRKEGIQKHPKYRKPKPKEPEGITLNLGYATKTKNIYIPFLDEP